MVSVIVPTYNGAHKILNVLKALEQQTYQDFETIIVIDGSTDGTYEILHTSEIKLTSLRVIQQKNKGRAAVRNRGVQEAKGDLLIFFDDDIRPIKQCVELHLEHHKLKPSSILVGNPMEEPKLAKTDIQRYRVSLSQKWLEPMKNNFEPLTKEMLFLSAANFSIAKSVFLQLDGFNEQLTDAEDFHFANKAFKSGIPVFFNYEAIGWHDDFITCASYISRQREYARAMQNFDTLVGNRKNILEKKAYLKKYLLSWVCRSSIVKWIDEERGFLYLLPKRVRYRFYSALIWGYAKYFPDRNISH